MSRTGYGPESTCGRDSTVATLMQGRPCHLGYQVPCYQVLVWVVDPGTLDRPGGGRVDGTIRGATRTPPSRRPPTPRRSTCATTRHRRRSVPRAACTSDRSRRRVRDASGPAGVGGCRRRSRKMTSTGVDPVSGCQRRPSSLPCPFFSVSLFPELAFPVYHSLRCDP